LFPVSIFLSRYRKLASFRVPTIRSEGGFRMNSIAGAKGCYHEENDNSLAE
jgi:hypothetical protein